MSSSSARARRGGSLQFPVGRWRHVAVVDTGCGCRPRRATSRLLSQLPSFLRPSPKPPQQPPRSSSRSSSGFFPSSASTASSSAATFTTTHSSYSNYSAYSNSYSAAAASYAKPQHPTAASAEAPPPPASSHAAASRRRQQQGRRKKRYEKMGAAAGQDQEEDVGVAVEKESSDPRADFRESMVQMVVEMGLCGWDDLRCMLRRLLALNAPRHHAAILAAFAEVCAQLTAPPPHPAYHAYDYHYHY
ncbi:hypothetical protein SEVIR_7G308900v4 [Setaria viridis]|uniref:Transcription repressor n=3 Tax=Setaria TaxID=4554 RepID=A0A368S154_SETIT|nr:transcription repressor OFP8 [Setaria italica]XP_034602419.1 transcription repressor OFP8-like [Setaria viridis]RCV36156.1 hypothetical protein SETIT_7G297200v2 [Setaria italica]TKW07464.1 hypothetical protein SEVIR_7G308900v2 [Setaria viridis]